MIDNPNHVLVDVFAECLAPLGFKKKGLTWKRLLPEVTQLVNLQRSSFGPLYYVNFGIWFNALGDLGNKDYSWCHLVGRIGRLAAPDGNHKPIDRLFDLEMQFTLAQRQAEIRQLLQAHLIPLLQECETVEGTKAVLTSGRKAFYSFKVPARAYLGL